MTPDSERSRPGRAGIVNRTTARQLDTDQASAEETFQPDRPAKPMPWPERVARAAGADAYVMAARGLASPPGTGLPLIILAGEEARLAVDADLWWSRPSEGGAA